MAKTMTTYELIDSLVPSDLWGANLGGADLQGAKTENAKGLEQNPRRSRKSLGGTVMAKIRFTSFNIHGCAKIKLSQDRAQNTIWTNINFLDENDYTVLSVNVFDRVLSDFIGTELANKDAEIAALRNQIDQLQNEVNAVEWVNGRIEKELFECRRR